ncbi:MAG: HEAT repeat domain-containing protein [Candidatus Cloacimonetes bacterium]|nr:HEAT repeat domain-containing protein [Candidatus Cloacimonadota bacterium]
MLDSFKLKMARNDPHKLYELFQSNRNIRPQIVERLKELNEENLLLEIAKKDMSFREEIVNDFIDNNMINLNTAINILGWMNISKTHKRLLHHIVDNLPKNDIMAIFQSPQTDRVTRNSLENVIKAKDKNLKKNADTEDYMRLRMLVEDFEIPEEEHFTTTPSETKKKLLRLAEDILEKREKLNADELFNLLKKTIIDFIRTEASYKDYFLSLLSLTDLSASQKLEILKESRNTNLIYPEIFIFFTEASYSDFSDITALLSKNFLSEWHKRYCHSTYLSDLVSLAKQYPEFRWVHSVYKNNTILETIFRYENNIGNIFTEQFCIALYDLIPDQNVKNKLKMSSFELQASIVNNLNVESFKIEKYIKTLLLIGGDFNYSFIAKILKRKIVENPIAAIGEIENTYLSLKKKIDDPAKLALLIQQEVSEKSNLISESVFQKVIKTYIKFFSSYETISKLTRRIVVENLPDPDLIKEYLSSTNNEYLCKFISLFNLTDYKHILKEHLQSEDYNTAICAAITMKTMGDSSILNYLQNLTESNNYNIRKKIAATINPSVDEQLDNIVLKLSRDENYSVSSTAILKLQEFPYHKAIEYFKDLVYDDSYRNKDKVAGILGEFNSPQVIPLLVEITKDENVNTLVEVIRALGKIESRLSIPILKTMNLHKMPFLEIEKAKSLILHNDFEGWEKLINYMDLNFSYISNYAKTSFIELANADYFSHLKELTFDESPLVACLATMKIYMFNEEEGKEAIYRLKNLRKPDVNYHLTLLLSFLPAEISSEVFEDLLKTKDYSVITIIAILRSIGGDDSHLQDIEAKVIAMEEYSQNQIIKAIHDLPSFNAVNILEKLASLQNEDNLQEIVESINHFEIDYIIEFIDKFWGKSDVNTKKHLAWLISENKHPFFVSFIKQQIEKESFIIMTELAYALILQGEDGGWIYLQNLINNESPEIQKYCLEVVSRLKNKKALDLITTQLNHVNESVVAQVIKSLGNLSLKEALPFLQKFLNSSSDRVKMAVAKALGDMPFKESKKMLEAMALDSNEYVRTLANIAIEKHEKGIDIEISPYDAFKALFKKTSWKLNEYWFQKEYQSFITDYREFAASDIDSFIDKTILEESEIQLKNKEIQETLTKELSGSTDIKKIMAAKESAREKTELLRSKEELIKSIIMMDSEKLSNSEWKLLWETAGIKDPDLIKALLIASCRSESINWLPILEKIIIKARKNIDMNLLIFSLSRKLYTKTISLLILFISNERARYYLLFFINYFLINPEKIDRNNLEMAVSRLAKLGKNNYISLFDKMLKMI